MAILVWIALGGGDGLGKVFAYKGRVQDGPSNKRAGVDDSCPGGDNGAKIGVVQISHQIFERFHFVCAVDISLRKRWIGRRCQRGESYVSEDVGSVAAVDDSESAVFDKADGVGGENGEVAIITKLADGD